MKKLLSLTLGLLSLTLAQPLSAQRACGTMQHKAIEEQLDPKSVQRRQQIEAFTQNYTQQMQTARTGIVYNIPVVFHVVYANATENIPDSRLMEQLDVLNKDFRKLNTDIGLVPAAWTNTAADCEINFCLATLDPQGNPTTGITRTSTTVGSFSLNDAVKYTAQGGRDVWNRDLYLNIWVCDLGGGLLGYAQFPGGTAATDGVVLDYAYTGKTGASAPYNLGRTGTHEVGHWLNLYHIWGDDNGACNGSDQVADTPNQAAETGGCPTGVVTDACTGSAPGIMWMNYMDYTNDACMYFFTNGQRTRVQAAMAGPRAALANSNRCSGSSTVSASFAANVTTGCAPLTVNFTDQSIGAPTSWSWNFGGGGTPNTSTQQNPSVTFSTPGTYTVTLVASNAGSSDTETQTAYITVIGSTPGVALPFQETFESGSFNTNNWTLENPDNATTWQIVTSTGTTPGTQSAKMDFYNYASTGQRDGLVTRPLNFSGLATAQMTFEHAYRRYNTNSSDSLIIWVSTTCGVWTRVLSLGENGTGTFATAGTTTTDWSPTGSNQWCMGTGNAPCYTVNLTPYVGNSSVQIRFQGYNNYGNNLYLDNINITGTPSAAAPVANFNPSATAVCAGGSITFTDASTNSPTSWSWNFGGGGTPNTSTSQSPTVVFNTPGTYGVTLTATNANGSDQEVRTNYITVRQRPTATATNVPTTCGQNNGSATASATGGTPGYTYAWSNGGTTATVSPLATGTYTVTVTDVNGCTGTTTTTINATPQPTASITNTQHTTCGLANGSATVTASSGTSPYTYAWSTGATTATASNLPAGTHTVTITDASLCTLTRTVTINSSNGISATTSSTTSGCGVSTGTATVAPTGGTGYTYLWSNNATTATISGLAAGSYTVTVTSSGGCTTTAVATVSNSGAPTASIPNFIHTSCGLNNGSASAVATGGSGTYTYLWSNSATTAVVNNLAAGTYTVTVTDQANCSAVTSVVINPSSSPVATASSTTTTCAQNNGSATASATLGTGAYTYLWSNGGTTATINGLAPGSYTVTVTDAAGCTGTATTQVGSSSVPTVSASVTTTPGCGLSNGSATATGSGGTGTLSYAWSNGQNGATASNLQAGTYTVTVTDANGCTATSSVVLQAQAGPTATILQQQNVLCFGDETGAASSNATGGTAPYTYLWSDGQTTPAASSLTAGTYTVTVTDAGGCTSTATVTITQPSVALSGTSSSTNESAAGAGDGTATVTPAGGTPPYTYFWSNGQTTQTANNLSAGTYDVTITDANGCTTVVNAQVGVNVAIDMADLIGLEVFPNPNAGAFTVGFQLPNPEALRLTLHNALGQIVWSQDMGIQHQGRIQVQLPAMATGVYHLELNAGEVRAVKMLMVKD